MTATDPSVSSLSLSADQLEATVAALAEEMIVWAPTAMPGRGRFVHQDVIRYAPVRSAADIEWRRKSDFTAKEIVFPPNETMFHLVGDRFMEPDLPDRPGLVFLRVCDVHGLDRCDRLFLENGANPDPYYMRRRRNLRFALIECTESFDNCFCVSLGNHTTDQYDLSFRFREDGGADVACKADDMIEYFPDDAEPSDHVPEFVSADRHPVNVPDIDRLHDAVRHEDIFDHPMWAPYSHRCIACGRCNFSCPTCTCFATVDHAAGHTPEIGERRRVWTGCHVDHFTDMAGGHCFREEYSSRMRFKTMHKIYDYHRRFGVHMCVGCGRCDDQCPEYISLSNCINVLSDILDREESPP